MTINTSAQAIAIALKQTRNKVGTCQQTVRTWFNSPSVGDVDHDGDADAVDGWKSEPVSARHPGDRNPPGGVPLAFGGGSHGFGHRAMTLANPGRIRSTDMSQNRYCPGVTSTVTGATTSDAIAVLEHSMGITYLGWSETIDGQKIPSPIKHLHTSRGKRVDQAVKDATALVSDIKHAARDAKETKRNKELTKAANHAERALNALKRVPFIK